MSTRRLLAALIVVPFAVYAACKDTKIEDDHELSANTDGGELPGSSGGSSGGTSDGAAPAPTCEGNPLNGEADGGAVVTGVRPIGAGPFLDGPQWLDQPNPGILYSEVNAETVVRNGPDGGMRSVFRELGPTELPIGNALTGGYIFTAVSTTAGTGNILRTRVDGTDPRAFAAAPAGSPNHIVGSSKGFVYFTDPGFQALIPNPVTGVYRMGLDGGVDIVQQFNGGSNPGARADGIALTADEKTLYVGLYDERRILKFTVADDGAVGPNPATFAVAPADVPTGLAVDVAGNLWVAENDAVTTNIRGRVEVFSPTGFKWGEIPFNDSRPTDVAFGGADRKTVFVTTERDNAATDAATPPMGTLYVFSSRCAGVP